MKINNGKITCLLLTFAVCLFAVVESAKAQRLSSEPYIVKGDSNAGELNSAYLDMLTNEYYSNNERFFVIARLGRGETVRSLNLKRLQAARSFLVKMKGISKEQIVFAEGERVTDEGRIEFYLGNKLRLISLAGRGKNVSLVCCTDITPQRKSNKQNMNEIPAEIVNMTEADSLELLNNPVIKTRLKKLLGKQNYDSFLASFESVTPVVKEGSFLFSSGCLIHACTKLESAIAIDLKNKTVHAAIYNQTARTKYFNENGSKTPKVIKDWADRLATLKQ